MTNNVEIIKISETEFIIGLNKLSLIEENIIHVIAQGEQTTEIALEDKKICEMLSANLEQKVNYLIDLNKCGKNSPGARQIWKELSELETTNKVATYGLNPVSRVIASFVLGNLTKGNMRFFKTKEEAMNWILS
jgi:hypothetical protein